MNKEYNTPLVDVVALVVEQVIASSTGAELDDMDKNGVYDELF